MVSFWFLHCWLWTCFIDCSGVFFDDFEQVNTVWFWLCYDSGKIGTSCTSDGFPFGIYMFKVNDRNTRTRCEICSKLTINFEQVNTDWTVSLKNSKTTSLKRLNDLTLHLNFCTITYAHVHLMNAFRNKYKVTMEPIVRSFFTKFKIVTLTLSAPRGDRAQNNPVLKIIKWTLGKC